MFLLDDMLKRVHGLLYCYCYSVVIYLFNTFYHLVIVTTVILIKKDVTNVTSFNKN